MQVSPQQAAAGESVTLSGGGFPPGSPLQAELFSDPVLLGTMSADSAGNYRRTVVIPLGTTPGFHTIRVSVVGGTLQAETTIFVTAPVTPLVVAQTTGASLSRTGAEVVAPARVAVALVALGAVLVGLSWKGRSLKPWPPPRRRWP